MCAKQANWHISRCHATIKVSGRQAVISLTDRNNQCSVGDNRNTVVDPKCFKRKLGALNTAAGSDDDVRARLDVCVNGVANPRRKRRVMVEDRAIDVESDEQVRPRREGCEPVLVVPNRQCRRITLVIG